MQRWDAASVFAFGEVRPMASAKGADSYAEAKRVLTSKKLDADGLYQVYGYAFFDVFGMEPEGVKASSLKGDKRRYGDWVKANLEELAKDGEAYRSVIGRAYRFVIQRDPYEEEFSYWEERGVFPYAVLVGCVEDWARRNQPGLMVTAGRATISVNCPYLTTLRLAPSVADEVRAEEGISAVREEGEVIVYPGSGGVLSMGGVEFVLSCKERDS